MKHKRPQLSVCHPPSPTPRTHPPTLALYSPPFEVRQKTFPPPPPPKFCLIFVLCGFPSAPTFHSRLPLVHLAPCVLSIRYLSRPASVISHSLTRWYVLQPQSLPLRLVRHLRSQWNASSLKMPTRSPFRSTRIACLVPSPSFPPLPQTLRDPRVPRVRTSSE